MKIISRKAQNEAAGALAMINAVLDMMHSKLQGMAGADEYFDAMAECYWLSSLIGGDTCHAMYKHGRACNYRKLKQLGFGRDGAMKSMEGKPCVWRREKL